MIIRYLAAFFLASIVTFGLFFLMQRLIAAGEIELNKDDVRIRVSLGNVRDAQEIREIVRKPEEVKPELAPEMEIQMSLSVAT